MGVGTVDLISQVKKLLDGNMMIPSIQRDYVWPRAQIPRLLDSLYKHYPVGSLLVWETTLDVPLKPAAVVQGTPLQGQPGVLLDGQQRLTSIARVYRPESTPAGVNPPDVRFDLRTEAFVNPSATTRSDPFLVPVGAVIADDAQFAEILAAAGIGPTDADYQLYYERLNRVRGIRNYPIAIQTYSSDRYEEVAEIFARVNTGGRRLSKGDLAMSAIAARWSEGLDAVNAFQKELAGYDFPLDREAILRLMGLMAGVGADSVRLIRPDMTGDRLKQAWSDTAESLRLAVDFFKNAASVPKSGLLTSPNVVVVPSYLLSTRQQRLMPGEQEQLRRWAYTAMAFSHYSNQVESKLDAEAKAIRELPYERLWDDLIRRASGPRSANSPLTPVDLEDKTSRSPLFNLLYIAALDARAQDWWHHLALAGAPVGRGHKIEYHHIFPKAKVRHVYPQRLWDSIANLGFLSALGNKKVGAKDPAVYLAEASSEELEKQWVPLDPALWSIERFPEFCAARRRLLAAALNRTLGLPAPDEAAPGAMPIEDEDLDSAELDESEIGFDEDDEDVWHD